MYSLTFWENWQAQSAETLIELTDKVCDSILGRSSTLESAAELLKKTADIEQKGFEFLR